MSSRVSYLLKFLTHQSLGRWEGIHFHRSSCDQTVSFASEMHTSINAINCLPRQLFKPSWVYSGLLCVWDSTRHRSFNVSCNLTLYLRPSTVFCTYSLLGNYLFQSTVSFRLGFCEWQAPRGEERTQPVSANFKGGT